MKSPTRKLPSGLTGFTDGDGEWHCTGSQMGRCNFLPSDNATVRKLHLVRLRMSADGCYDSGGAYWGQGAPLYWAYVDSTPVEAFFRASDRADARRQTRPTHEAARPVDTQRPEGEE